MLAKVPFEGIRMLIGVIESINLEICDLKPTELQKEILLVILV